ncbi:MAG: hypothetical protein R3B84_10995 [Zavarzinella sp.]
MKKSLRGGLAALISVGVFIWLATAGDQPTPKDPSKEVVKQIVPDEVRYWKGNLHTHSLWSDGDDFPEMIADWYKTEKYDFLALTDHNVIAEGDRWIPVKSGTRNHTVAMDKYLNRFGPNWVEVRKGKTGDEVRLKPLREFRSLVEESGKFLMIPAEEISASCLRAPIHMNGINLRDVIKPQNEMTVAETIRMNLRAVGDQQQKSGWPMFTFLNHPNFGWAVQAEQMAVVEELKFFEVFNGHPSVRNYGDATHASTEQIWDIILALRLGKLNLPLVYGVGTDDAHRYHKYAMTESNPGRGWVMVKARHLTAESIVRAMNAGDFYASSGVTLKDVSKTPKELVVEVAAEAGIEYRIDFIGTMKNTPLTATPVLDSEGKQLNVTNRYDANVGKVLQTSKGSKAVYQFTGNELYVRAKIVSTKAHPRPYEKGDMETAWTQPVVP